MTTAWCNSWCPCFSCWAQRLRALQNSGPWGSSFAFLLIPKNYWLLFPDSPPGDVGIASVVNPILLFALLNLILFAEREPGVSRPGRRLLPWRIWVAILWAVVTGCLVIPLGRMTEPVAMFGGISLDPWGWQRFSLFALVAGAHVLALQHVVAAVRNHGVNGRQTR